MDINQVQPEEWITIGIRDAVVCTVYKDKSDGIEVVYLDDRDRAINEDIRFVNNKWEFVSQGSNGGYADNYDRLSKFVAILRAGRYGHKHLTQR